MTTPDPIEARLDAIEARCAEWLRYPVPQSYHHAPGDLAWIVGLVRRYRRALESIRNTEWPPGHSISGARDMKETASKALNEEVPPALPTGYAPFRVVRSATIKLSLSCGHEAYVDVAEFVKKYDAQHYMVQCVVCPLGSISG